MPKFRKKPVVIEAVQYDERAAKFGWGHAIADAHPWLEIAYEDGTLDNVGRKTPDGIVDQHLTIKTLEGTMRADPGDWVIRGIKGEIYPCKPDIFEATYDPVTSTNPDGEMKMNKTLASQLSDHLQHDHPAEPVSNLWTAPGAADFTFGSVLSTLIAYAFNRVESLNPHNAHRYYTECRHCDGTDEDRKLGVRSQIDLVKHKPGCLLEKHLPRLRAMANRDVT